MTLALVDVPRCLNVDASYVGPPRALVTAPSQPTGWSAALPRGGTRAYRNQAVEECLDTVAVLRTYREPLDGEIWMRPAASERRLLAQVNAIIALGPDALERVMGLSLDADVPDPGRVFAALLVVGCVEGRRWLEPARDIFVTASVRNANEAAAAIEALSLCPNAGVAALLAPLLDDERPRVRVSAARVLAFRGALTETQWNNALCDSDLAVVAAALSAPLSGYDPVACERALRPLLARDDGETLARLAIRAGLSLGLDRARVRAHEIARSDPSWAGVAHLLALAGDLDAAPYVRETLDGPRVLDGVRTAVVLGSIELVPDLLALLDRKGSPPETGISARQALATITGLGFTTTENATQAVSLWSQRSSSFRSGVRYRNGRPWSLDMLLESLRTGPGARSIRQDVYFEMLNATASHVSRFSPYDFVGVQIQSLRQIERWLADLQVRRNGARSDN